MPQKVSGKESGNMNKKFPKERFNLREAKGDNYYRIMMVNESLKGFQYKQEFPWLLHFDIELKETTKPFLLRTKRESKVLNNLEDRITSLIKATIPYQFIGRITDTGHRELFFYIHSPEEVHKNLQILIRDNKEVRPWKYSIDKDADWKSVDFFFGYQ